MNMSRLRFLVVVSSILLVGCDHYTKHVAKTGLERQPPHTLVAGILDLSYTENRDSGFGLLRKVPQNIRTPLLTTVQLVSGLAFLIVSLRKKHARPLRLGLLLVSAGAVGNGLDRLIRGYVVDFIHIHYWPVFNVADIYITVGAGLLILASRRALRAPAPPGPP